jgi:hypothetical protein
MLLPPCVLSATRQPPTDSTCRLQGPPRLYQEHKAHHSNASADHVVLQAHETRNEQYTAFVQEALKVGLCACCCRHAVRVLLGCSACVDHCAAGGLAARTAPRSLHGGRLHALQWMAEGRPLRELAALYRTQVSGDRLAKPLRDARIPFQMSNSKDLWQTKEVRVGAAGVVCLLPGHCFHAFRHIPASSVYSCWIACRWHALSAVTSERGGAW